MAANDSVVIVSDREFEDTTDAFKCFDAHTGEELWAIRYPAIGQLDYGNSPRATPLLWDDLVILHGAFGELTAADVKTGNVHWQINIRDEFKARDERPWGTCSSPLIVDDKLIINPGAKDASLVALNPRTGKVIWKSPGKAASYGSLLAGTFGGVEQIVGFDEDSLGGWSPKTGERLWRHLFRRESKFNVPTPIRTPDGNLLMAVENNGTFLLEFDTAGKPKPEPTASFQPLSPDTHTPTITANRLFGCWRKLYCLDLNDGLTSIWESKKREYDNYCAIIASADRVLVITMDSELILLDAAANEYRELGRMRVFPEEKGCYSHPALVGTKLFVRGSAEVVCVELAPN